MNAVNIENLTWEECQELEHTYRHLFHRHFDNAFEYLQKSGAPDRYEVYQAETEKANAAFNVEWQEYLERKGWIQSQ